LLARDPLPEFRIPFHVGNLEHPRGTRAGLPCRDEILAEAVLVAHEWAEKGLTTHGSSRRSIAEELPVVDLPRKVGLRKTATEKTENGKEGQIPQLVLPLG
jgi:hypothetical protein